jgi:hypothetical protein
MARYPRRYGGADDEPVAAPAPAPIVSPPAAASTDNESVSSKEEEKPMGGRRRRSRRRTLRPVRKGTHVKAKTLRRLLKSKGLKTSGKKSTLRARAREAHLIRGGNVVSY